MYNFIFLLLTISPVETGIQSYYCDKITLNYVYDDTSSIRLTQLLLSEIDYKKGIWACRECVIIPDKAANLRIEKRGNLYYWWCEAQNCFVYSKNFEIIGSTNDIEVEERQNYKNVAIERDFGITPAAKKRYLDNIRLLDPQERDRMHR